jgi:hypothetical protein
MWGRAQGGSQFGFQHALHHPVGQRLEQAMLPKDVARVGIVWEQFVSQGFGCGVHTGHRVLLHVCSSLKITSYTLTCRPSNNIAVMECQIELRYISSSAILNPFLEAETDEAILERG